MQAEGRPVDIRAVTGIMDEEHRDWFASVTRFTASSDSGRKGSGIRTLMQAPYTGAGHYSDLI